MPPTPDFDRDRELETIRAQYENYERAGRHELWNLNNPGFDRLVRERDAQLMRLLGESVSGLPGPILDVGTGSGRLVGVGRDLGLTNDWVGVDIDADALDKAKLSYPWADFVVASADQLPAADASASAVIASVLFSSLPSPEFESAVAREIERVLRPGGWLIWYDLRLNNPRNPAVHGINQRAIERLFPRWEIDVRPMSLLPPLARRLGLSTRIAYPALHAIPLLRSHLIGRLRPKPTDRTTLDDEEVV